MAGKVALVICLLSALLCISSASKPSDDQVYPYPQPEPERRGDYRAPYSPYQYGPPDHYAPTRCAFNETRVLVDQSIKFSGYQAAKSCRAQITIRTCGGNCNTNSYGASCNKCCRASSETSWVPQTANFYCGYGLYKPIQWFVLEPKFCYCTYC